ncbi:MAG: T9SS type A sorting domain-containing protein [Candidatus Kapaibacterium sp.]
MKHFFTQISLLYLFIIGSSFLYYSADAALPSNTPGTLQHTLGGHSGEILDASWSPDSKYVLTGSEDKTAIIWDATSGKRLQTLNTNYKNGVYKVHWSPDGTKVSTCGSGNSYFLDGSDIWDARTGDKLLTINGVVSEWSPDGKWLFIGSFDSTAYILDGNTLDVVKQLQDSTPRINAAKWSTDSKKILTRGAGDTTAVVRSVPSGTTLLTLPGIKSFNLAISWSDDGTRIKTLSDTSLVTWNALSGERIATVTVPFYYLNFNPGECFSPDGTKIIYGNTVHDTQSGKIVSMLVGHTESRLSFSWSPDSRHLATSGADNIAILWDTETGTNLHILRGHGTSVPVVRWSPDGSRVVTGGGVAHTLILKPRAWPDFTVRIWDVNNGKQLHVLMPHAKWVNTVDWSPDGSLLASSSSDSTTIIWNATTGDTVHILRGHRRGVSEAYWSPSGDRILTRGSDSIAILWDAVSGNRLRTFAGDTYLWHAAWSPDGKQIATAFGNSVIIWDAGTGTIIDTLQGHTDYVYYVTWSPIGKYIATVSNDKTVLLWDALSGEKLATLSTSEYRIAPIAWSTDGYRIAVPTGKADKATAVWDVNTRTILFTVPMNSNINWYGDGKRLLVENTIYDGFTGVYLDSLSSIIKGTLLSPDRTQAAQYFDGFGSADSTRITIWDTKTGNKLYDMYRVGRIGTSSAQYVFKWCPDGTRIAGPIVYNIVKIWLINTSTSVQEENTPLRIEAGFSLSPNPTDNSLHLSFATERAVASAVQICDLLGRTVATADIPAGTKQWTMSVGNLPAGVYVVRWGGVVQKLVVR